MARKESGGKMTMTFEKALKLVDEIDDEEVSDYWATHSVEDLVNDLRETYAPKITMTSEQKEEFMAFVNSPDDNFENFWFCLGSGSNLYIEFTEEELMRVWLHPELIEVAK